MSPEQLRSTAEVDHRTDIWSLGATLHELLTGKPAFDPSFTLPELVATILHKPAPSLRKLRKDVPEELAAIVARCLAKNRDQRFENAADLARALLKFAPPRARGPAERAASMRPAFPNSKPSPELAGVAARTSWQRRADRREMRRKGQVAVGAPPSEPASSTLVIRRPTTLDAARNGVTAAYGALLTRGPALALWGGGALLVVLATLLSSARTPEPRASVLIAPPPEAPVPSRADEASSSEPIDLLVRVFPSSARIIIDGAPVSSNPFHARYPRDEKTHRILAFASGFDSKSEEVLLENDVVIEMRLQRHSASPAHRAAPALPLEAASATPSPASSLGPVVAPRVETPEPTLADVNPGGGRTPLRPIETKNPYELP
jgi:serine/threonine-protein kinase